MSKAWTYIRLSTDHQEASLEDQTNSVVECVQGLGYQIVRSFCDDGVSGKTADARPGFQSLIQSARENTEDITLLVYDVSRFGRFENPRESTYWEVELERNGVRVHYVSEGFVNDGSLGSQITKFIKDAEASEYIKKLSKAVRLGFRSTAERGYWHSPTKPYGSKRAVIDPKTRVIERVLEPGQWKGGKEKRITLVPGNTQEVETVRTSFDLYGNREQGLQSIMHYLMEHNIPSPGGKPRWHIDSIRHIITNPTYIGATRYHPGREDELIPFWV
ncbi:MAG: recombinase family protein [Candidatus Nanoarchaeia archaeon]